MKAIECVRCVLSTNLLLVFVYIALTSCTPNNEILGEYNLDIDKTFANVKSVPDFYDGITIEKLKEAIGNEYAQKTLSIDGYYDGMPEFDGQVGGVLLGGWTYSENDHDIEIHNRISGPVYSLWGNAVYSDDTMVIQLAAPKDGLTLYYVKQK